MADMMTFPNTVEEFMEQYKITDTEQIYTNGAELVPIFRMKQWFDHKPAQRWIPVSKRLPEYSGQYYVSGGNKAWICEFLIIPNFKGGWCNYTGGWCNDASNPVVQAWMPLPEPYQGKRKGEE